MLHNIAKREAFLYCYIFPFLKKNKKPYETNTCLELGPADFFFL